LSLKFGVDDAVAELFISFTDGAQMMPGHSLLHVIHQIHSLVPSALAITVPQHRNARCFGKLGTCL